MGKFISVTGSGHEGRFLYQSRAGLPVRAAAAAKCVVASWDVLRRSGYLEAWGIEGDERAWYERYRGAIAAFGERNTILLLRDETGPFSAISMTRQESGHHLLHNLGMLPSHRARATGSSANLEAMLLALTDQLVWQGNGDYEVIMEDAAGQCERIYHEFHGRGWPAGQSRFARTHAFRLKLEAARLAPDSGELREPTAEERAKVTRLSHHARIDCARVSVLGPPGAPEAAVVIDSGPELNLFGLMNRAQLVKFREGPLASTSAERLLAGAARAALGQGAAQAVLLHGDSADFPALDRAGWQYVAPAIHWIAKKELLPHWQRHISETLGSGKSLGSRATG